MPRLEHIGIAVRDAGAVARLYEALLEAMPYKTETVEREGVRTHFISAETAKIELLESLGPDSPVARFLEKRGEGLHHLAFEVADIDDAMTRLRAAGFEPLSDTPLPGADGKRIFFLHPKQTHGVLVECCQSVPSPNGQVEIECDEGPFSVYESGKPANPALVILTGATHLRMANLAPLIQAMVPSFHVLIPDNADASLAIRTDHALATLDHFGLPLADLLGLGDGGSVALSLAHRNPARIGRVALHEADPFFDGRSAAELSGIRPCVLVTAGDRSAFVPFQRTLRLCRTLPHSALAILPGTGQAFQKVNLDTFVPILRDWFGR